MNRIDILGIRLSNFTKEQILKKVEGFIKSEKSHYIVTPNPEIILEAGHDEELFYILNSADISIADGMGLKFAALLEKEHLNRITGADISLEILSFAEKNNIKVGILNWKDGLSQKHSIEISLQTKYPDLNFFISEIDRKVNQNIDKDFLNFEPEIIFLTLGAPYQEKFIYHNKNKIESAKVLIGVGGTFDFLTGRIKRSPKFLRVLGLEWIWRLLKQPFKRSKRIYNAVFVFSCKVLKKKFIHPFFYRKNVSCILYKRDNHKLKILLVERQEEKGHWQLPQGGTDGEDLMKAGCRELQEELNLDSNKLICKRVFKDIYKYKFGERPGENNVKAAYKRKHTGYKGQSQGLCVAEFTGKDEDIKINFWDHSAWKWIDADKLEEEVHLIRKRAAHRILKKFKEVVR